MSPDELPASPDPAADLQDLSTLTDPLRRRLYEEVAAHDAPVGREEAATAVGTSRTLAAYHLDRLAEAGLVSVTYSRPAGAGGPGAGRPAKRYARVAAERAVSVPPRRYALLAELLAAAIEEDEDGAVARALLRAARGQGRALGREETGEPLAALLARLGYEPAAAEDGDVDLRNCPFHRLSRRHTALVCGMNRALLEGVLDGRGEDPARAELCPREGRCCVVVRAAR